MLLISLLLNVMFSMNTIYMGYLQAQFASLTSMVPIKILLPYSGVLSILMDRYIQLEQGQASQFQIFGDGQQTRDFIYIEDVLTALDLVATKSEALGHVYNVGTEVAISLIN